MRLRVLGPIELDDGNGAISLAPQVRRLVALLVAAEGEPVSADRVAEHLGDGDVGGSAVRTAMLRVRKVLGDRVDTSQRGYRLRLLDGDELDADRFVALCDRALVLGPADRCRVLADALRLWRGPVLDELADEAWAAPFAMRLDERRAGAVEDLGESLIAVGRAVEAIELLERHAVEQPYRERPLELLMRALAAAGRATEAVRAFQRFRMALREDIGIEPSASLRQVEAEVLGGLDEPRPAPTATRMELPTGTVTFLFTDIEASTERWQRDESAMAAALARHDEVIRTAVRDAGGTVFKHTGDGICAVFTSAAAAGRAAVAAQQLLELPVRMGLHTGEAELRDDDYFGTAVNRAARVMDAGHGGQILVSAATAALIGDHDLVDLGEHDLKGLSTPERVHQIGAATTFPPLRAGRHRVGNLPTGLTSFVGRERELAALADHVTEHRLVTLIGVGGTGKTRLAIEAAHLLGGLFPDGCWLAELAPVVAPEAVPFALTSGLGFTAPMGADVEAELIRRLAHRRALIVVDNCEHVLEAVAGIVERIIERCPAVTVVATSREPLMVAGEQLVPVPSLAPADGLQLFLDRAAAEEPDAVFEGTQAEAVAELCRRLDGLPLAIELAASRVRSFSPVELVDQLDERFRLLVGGRRSRTERHQTMRSTLDWSYQLCGPVERAVFDRLSVFPASFDLASARAVASGDGVGDLDVVDVVPRLVDRSLLQRTMARDGTTRFRMLETMRSYGRSHLVDDATADPVRRRHAEHVIARLGQPILLGPDEERDLDRTIGLRSDALVALDWCIDQHDWCGATRLVTPMIVNSTREGYEMGRRLRAAYDASGDRSPCEDELVVADVFGRMRDPADTNERVWRLLRSTDPLPDTHCPFPPHVAFTSITSEEVPEVLAVLDRYRTARSDVRATEYYSAAWVLAHFGHVDAAEVALALFDNDVAGRDSSAARRMSDSLRGTIAQHRHDLDTAVELLGAAARRDDSIARPPNWFDVFVELALLQARAVRGDVVDADDVRRAWHWLSDEGVHILGVRAAIATAAIAERAGEPDIARRLLAWSVWMLGSSTELEIELRDVTLDDVPTTSTDTLESIMALALDLADRLSLTP